MTILGFYTLSLERFKLESSNFMWLYQFLVFGQLIITQRGVGTPWNIFTTVKATVFEFCALLTFAQPLPKIAAVKTTWRLKLSVQNCKMERKSCVAPMLVTLDDLEGYFPFAGLFKRNPSHICAVFYPMSTDSVLARSLSNSWASCNESFCYISHRQTKCVLATVLCLCVPLPVCPKYNFVGGFAIGAVVLATWYNLWSH